MTSNSAFFWFFIIGGLITATVGIGYFASGGSSTATDAQNYSILLQIPLGAVASLYGIRQVEDCKQKRN